MLPAELPQISGVNLGARYQPSAPGSSAGGDFYDAFVVPDGRLALLIGDVVGHDVAAAAVMGQVRASLRVLAMRHGDPAEVLGGLDSSVASLGPEMFVTALLCLLDTTTGELTAATAGHPPPLLRRRQMVAGSAVAGSTARKGGTARYLDLPSGPPLGIPGCRRSGSTHLDRGDLLLLFTDGLVEVAGGYLGTGLDRLRDLALEYTQATDPREFCTAALAQLGTGSDDIALLALTLDDGRRRSAAVDLPAESTAPGMLRSSARATLTGWGVPDCLADVALLCGNELVTNALLHARSGAHVEFDLDERRLLVLVTDTGLGSMPAVVGASPGDVRGRGLALI